MSWKITEDFRNMLFNLIGSASMPVAQSEGFLSALKILKGCPAHCVHVPDEPPKKVEQPVIEEAQENDKQQRNDAR